MLHTLARRAWHGGMMDGGCHVRLMTSPENKRFSSATQHTLLLPVWGLGMLIFGDKDTLRVVDYCQIAGLIGLYSNSQLPRYPIRNPEDASTRKIDTTLGLQVP